MKKGLALRAAKGFTLIELLVVIAIIGILVTVVTINLGSSRKKARRTQIAATAKEVITAANIYIEDNPDTGVGSDISAANLSSITTLGSNASSGKAYISSGITYNADSSFTFSLTNSGCTITVSSSNIPSPSNTTDFSGNSCTP